MLLRIVEHLAVLVAAVVLLGVPGAASVSLLRIRAALPDSLTVVAAALFGAAVACVATALQLLLQVSAWWAIGAHALLSLLLVAAAVVVHRRRKVHADLTVPAGRGWGRWTTAIVIASALFAWVVRGKIGLDGLYHVAVSRKLVELAEPAFGNVNRFADGGPNPTYALPGWHALVGWTSELAGGDVIISWEIFPVLIVALGALAAGGLARVLLDTPRAEPLGALAWVLMRVLYARREVDGDAILYGAVPGQVVFELVLPVVFAAIAVAMWTDARRVRRAALVSAVLGIALVVVFHANYVPYVAIVGVGYVAWWLATGPVTRTIARRTMVVGGVVALACAGLLGLLLPLLAQLENFGNAPEEARIDYHLTATAGLTHIRGGHAFEMLGIAGLLTMLAAPVVVARWRSRQMGVAAGGLLACCTVAFVPPLYALLDATGSLTVGLRLNHVIGVLLVPIAAGAMLLAASLGQRLADGRVRMVLVVAGALVVLVGVSGGFGYEKLYPDWIGYVGWLGIVVVWAWRLVVGRRRRSASALPIRTEAAAVSSRAILATAIVVVIGLGLPAGLISMRRAVADIEPLTAAPAAGELRCVGGPTFDALRAVPPGSVVLSDPGASFQAMAIAPVYIVGDYKIWNAATSDNRTVERLRLVNQFFDTSASDAERLEVLRAQGVDYLLVDVQDGRWLEAEPDTPAELDLVRANRAFDRFADVQNYDGGSIARLVRANREHFVPVQADLRGRRAAMPARRTGDEVPCNTFVLWKVVR
ncbi:MAG: hypothetical protein JWO69_1075 [Thermoleophilia bacterium]|jgi:hypothetical protein|nr:hypothetical protein [Thermoleophilia bacterium]